MPNSAMIDAFSTAKRASIMPVEFGTRRLAFQTFESAGFDDQRITREQKRCSG